MKDNETYIRLTDELKTPAKKKTKQLQNWMEKEDNSMKCIGITTGYLPLFLHGH